MDVPGRAVVYRWPGRVLVVVLVLLMVAALMNGCAKRNKGLRATGAVLNVVAHQDDDLLFQSPDLIHAVASGLVVRTVYVTAGDANQDRTYWAKRETGVKSAYAHMAGVADDWVTTDAGVPGHPMETATLSGADNLSLLFMRIPDGWLDGTGGSRHDHDSLQKLYQGEISTIGTVDDSSEYTKDSLVDTLHLLMQRFQPEVINTLDFQGAYGDGDHSDHHTVGYMTQQASRRYQREHRLVGYRGYGITDEEANVNEDDLATKTDTFLTYAAFDSESCDTLETCSNRPERLWLPRQYKSEDGLGTDATPSTRPGNSTRPTPSRTSSEVPPSGSRRTGNVARSARATASSENLVTGQTASKATNGVVVGYPQAAEKEWATTNGQEGSWLQLDWTQYVTVNQVVLFDRPNPDDHIMSGTVMFSDGSTVAVPSLSNHGYARTLTFPSRPTRSLRFTITSVSPSTVNAGLSEIQVWTE